MVMLVDGIGPGWNARVSPPPPPPPPPPPDPPQVLFNTNPRVVVPANVKPLPGAPPDRPLAGFIGPLTPEMEVLRSGPPKRPLEGFIGPLTPQQEVLRSGPPAILPRTLGDGTQPKTHPTGGLAPNDPRQKLIDQGYQLQDIDQQAKGLANQPLDIEGAKRLVQTANTNEGQFWSGVYSGLSPKQIAELKPLAQAIETAPDKAAALDTFERTLMPLLTPEQRTQLTTLKRASEDAQLHLEGQELGQRLQTAQLDSGFCGTDAQKAAAAQRLELVMVDARVHVSAVRQIEANRRLQDAQGLLMTPENQAKLGPAQQQLVDAARQVQLNPNDPNAQQRLSIAQSLFDGTLTQTISVYDKQTLDRLEAAVSHERALGGLLDDEAQVVHRYQEMSSAALARCGALNPTEQRLFDLAKADYGLLQKNRELRTLALQAGAADSEHVHELLGKLDGGMIEALRQRSDVDLNRGQFNRDVALHNQSTDPVATLLSLSNSAAPATTQNPTTVQPLGSTPPAAFTPVTLNQGNSPGLLFTNAATVQPVKAQSLRVAPEFALGMPNPDLSVDEATRQLQTLQHERDELEKLLTPPPPPKPSGWDHALNILAGVGEVALGIAVAGATFGGASVVGAAIIADGGLRTVHAVADAANGTSSDTLQSRALQSVFKLDRGAANRVDTVISFAATAPAGGYGSVMLALKATNAARAARVASWAAGAFGVASVADVGISQIRYGLFNNAAQPFSVQGLTAVGLTPTQANYVLFAGNMVATGGVFVANRGAVTPDLSPTQSAPPKSVPPPNDVEMTAPLAPVAAFDALAALVNPPGSPKPTWGNPGEGTGGANVSDTGPVANMNGLDFVVSGDLANGGDISKLPNQLQGAGYSQATTEPRKLVIIGAGNGGATFLADALANTQLDPVLLFRRDPARDRIAEMTGPITFNELMRGGTHQVVFRPEHFGYLYEESGRAALQQADTIVVTVPDIPSARLPLFEHMAESVRPGQTIALTGAGAQPALARLVDADARWNGTNWVLFENLPYGTRVDWDAGVITGKRKLAAQAAFWGDEDAALASLREMFPLGHLLDEPKPSWPNFEVVPHLSFAFQLGYGAHTMVAYHPLNLQVTRAGGQYFHWWDGAMRQDPDLAARIAVLDQERVQLTEAYGLPGENNFQRLHRMYGIEPPATQYELFQLMEPYYRSKSESSLTALVTGRYTTENFPNGWRSLWLAEKAGIELPETARVMAELEPAIRSVGAEVGIPDVFDRYNLYGYQEILEGFQGGIPEVTRLINEPHLGE